MNESHYHKVAQFNTLGGNLEKVTMDSLALQLDLCQEEYMELVEAFDNQDSVEFVDAVADLFVVLTGMIQKLEVLGVNVEEAIHRVCDNNLAKYPEISEEAFQDSSVFNLIPDGCSGEISYGRLVIKDNKTGKIRKPTNFKPVDLTNVPDFFKVIGGVV